MDLLVVDALEPEVLSWLESRRTVRHAPELALEPLALRRMLRNVRAAIVPSSVTIDAETLGFAPVLRAIGRVSVGAENIDIEACARRQVEVVRSLTASARAEAEFVIGAMLALLRRVPVPSDDGFMAGRELGGATVGLVGMPPAARSIAKMLSGFEVEVLGYDPSLHASDSGWGLWQVAPVGLRELIARADVLCVQLNYFSRYQGLIGERFLPYCKPNQVLVSTAHSGLFDEAMLAEALKSGRMAAAWFDSVEPGMLDVGRPLHGIATLQVTPRVACTTHESRSRSAWTVARRIDVLLDEPPFGHNEFRSTIPDGFADLEAEQPWP